MNQDEHDLLRAAKRLDKDALAAIYDRYSTPLFAYAYRLLGDAQLAEDCTSETFARFLRALRDGRGPEEYLQAYLYRVAHNWISDRYRREPPPPVELDEELPGNPNDNPDEQSTIRRQQEQMRAALHLLTPEQRQVVVLRFMEGMSTTETAAALDKPETAVKALQHRALIALKKILTGSEQDEQATEFA
jgi:RNA polymerase sigma-70 factor (ECF subfamily)